MRTWLTGPEGGGIPPSDSSRLRGGASSHALPKMPTSLQEGSCLTTEPAEEGAKRPCFIGIAGAISGRQAHICTLAARLGRALLGSSTTQSPPDSPAASAFALRLAAAGLRKSSGSSCPTVPSAPAASGVVPSHGQGFACCCSPDLCVATSFLGLWDPGESQEVSLGGPRPVAADPPHAAQRPDKRSELSFPPPSQQPRKQYLCSTQISVELTLCLCLSQPPPL